jgi:hypothetical protein
MTSKTEHSAAQPICPMLIVHLPSVIQGAKAALQQGLITGASSEEPDVLSEKLRLVWVCCAHAAVTAAVLAAPSAGSQPSPRSILQESHWRHTHPQVRPCSGLFRTCLGGSLPISVCTACASFAAALGFVEQISQILIPVTPALLQQVLMYKHSRIVSWNAAKLPCDGMVECTQVEQPVSISLL